MTVKKLKETKIIYNVLCVIDAIAMIIVAAFRPLHMIASSEMYSRQDKTGIVLCATFLIVFSLFLYHHHIYSIAEYRYRVAVHHKNQKRKEAQEQ